MLLCLVGGFDWCSLMSVQLNLDGTDVLKGDESDGRSVAGGACVAGVCPVSAVDMGTEDRSGMMVWGSGTTGREGRMGTVMFGQCGWWAGGRDGRDILPLPGIRGTLSLAEVLGGGIMEISLSLVSSTEESSVTSDIMLMMVTSSSWCSLDGGFVILAG